MAIDSLGTATLPGGVWPTHESSVSAVAWPAIMAGSVVAVAVTFILVALGSGVGFAAGSPWPGRGTSARFCAR